MAFGKLAMELTESIFKNIDHPGKNVPIPDSAFPDTSLPEFKEAMAKAVANVGNDLKREIASRLLSYIVGELHAQGRTNTEPPRVEPRRDIRDNEIIYVGTADQYASLPYRSRRDKVSPWPPGSQADLEYFAKSEKIQKEGDIAAKDVSKTALYSFNSKGEFLDVRFDGFGGSGVPIPASKYQASTYSPDGKMPVIPTASAEFVRRLPRELDTAGLYNALISKQAVSVGKWNSRDPDAPAAPITDDKEALKLLNAIYPIMFGMSGVAKSSGKYNRVSPLDTNERAMLTPTYGYDRDYNFTLTADAKLGGLSAESMKLIKDGLVKAVSKDADVNVSANGVKITNITKNVYLALGRRDSRVDGETMGSLD